MRRLVATGLALVALLAGCGSPDEFGPRVDVAGKVTLGGQPLKSGQIVFVPLATGAAGQNPIVDGSYALEGAQGLTPGSYRVEIHSIQPTGKKVFDRGEGEMIEETKNLVPAIYNANSKLQVEVKESGENTYVFDLELPSKGSR